MKRSIISENWKLRRIGEEDYINATVPGSVYGDYLAAGLMEDPFWKDNELEALELMNSDYEYSTEFVCDRELLDADKVLLRFNGLDTIADIELNNTPIGHADNMHRVWEYSVKELLREGDNYLKVSLHSPTRFIEEANKKSPTKGATDAMPGFVHIRKAHCMFGWDWGAHLPDAGIWREVELLGIRKAYIDTVEVLQYHEENRVRLSIVPELNEVVDNIGMSEGLILDVVLSAPSGDVVASKDLPVGSLGCEKAEIVINKPQLWWPNGYGDQNLYTLEVTLSDEDGYVLDSWSRKIGLRTLTIDRSKDKWGERFATCVNGVNIFAMGADYIPEDHLLGRVTPDTTRSLLEKARWANFNSIRVWGGGYYPDDWFYDACDELGLIVWQDFMFACGSYELTREFEENITAEFIDNIKRLRHHASLGLMCGNNEMEWQFIDNIWTSRPVEMKYYLQIFEVIIPRLMEKLAPQVFYWPASPSSGGTFDNPNDENRGDVHYWEVWHGNEPFSEYRRYYFRYLSEFGFQSFPSRKTVETFTDDERDMNIFSYIFERHQRNGAANGKIMNYMQQTYKYPTSFDMLIYASQLLQADAIRYGAEHLRRNRNDSRCMGAIYWQLNDCWPVASWSSIDYCQRLKPLHYYARRFFAPVMISCEEEGMINSGIDHVRMPNNYAKSIRLCVTNESLKDERVTVKWQLRNTDAEILRSEEAEIDVPALKSIWLEKVDMEEVKVFDEYVSFQALIDGNTVSEGTVIFSYPKYFNYKDPKLSVDTEGNMLTVKSEGYAKSVAILNDNEDLILSDNYFDLNGDSRTVEVLSGNIDNVRLLSVYDIH